MLHWAYELPCQANFQNSILYPLWVVLGLLACPSSIRVGVRQGSFWLEFCQLSYHLGCRYTRNEDGTLVADPRKYVDRFLSPLRKCLRKAKEEQDTASSRRSPSN